MKKILFHLAFPVHNLAAARKFYVEGLGCLAGRRSEQALILGLAGHQLVAHLTQRKLPRQRGIYPRHFGLVFHALKDWEGLLQRAKRRKLKFYSEPKIRFPGMPLEHRSFFLQDPSGNLLEFKYYKFASAVFGKRGLKKVGERS
jgi:extradiol dioxygenase family protein